MTTGQDSSPCYSLSLAEAIVKLKDAAVVVEDLAEVVGKVMEEFDRMHTALEFYADRRNYDDYHAPCDNDEHGMLDNPDKGKKARWALRRLDVAGKPLTAEQKQKVIEGMKNERT